MNVCGLDHAAFLVVRGRPPPQWLARQDQLVANLEPYGQCDLGERAKISEPDLFSLALEVAGHTGFQVTGLVGFCLPHAVNTFRNRQSAFAPAGVLKPDEIVDADLGDKLGWGQDNVAFDGNTTVVRNDPALGQL